MQSETDSGSRPSKLGKTDANQTRAGLRHIATEQRRRDRINEG
jgi:hypothetical protein